MKPLTDAPSGEFDGLAPQSGYSACAIRADRSYQCWGDNSSGQFAARRGKFVAVAAGGTHTCGLRPNGDIDCFGSDYWQTAAHSPATFKVVMARSWDARRNIERVLGRLARAHDLRVDHGVDGPVALGRRLAVHEREARRGSHVRRIGDDLERGEEQILLELRAATALRRPRRGTGCRRRPSPTGPRRRRGRTGCL
ncbi:hypothetical protein [Sorangium sp. So ce291]|uniref:hypothetical protein n=1 Tax=Sorangium sp. So ce291 TaxID=3133294 RepID=UPI003F5F0F0F